MASCRCAVCAEMAVPVPPKAPTDPLAPPGSLAKPLGTTDGLFRQPIRRVCPVLVIGARNHRRLKAALPESNKSMESSSRYPTTLGGEIRPIQPLARCQARIAAGLF